MAYNIETCSCTTFAVRVLKTAGIGRNFMTIKEHNWTIPSNLTKLAKDYSKMPKNVHQKLLLLLLLNFQWEIIMDILRLMMLKI